MFNKAGRYSEGKAYLLNLENNEKYFYANPISYCKINITDELINFELENLKILKKAHAFALKKEEEIKKLDQVIEESKKQILEAMKKNREITREFHENFFRNNASSIYISVESETNISIY